MILSKEEFFTRINDYVGDNTNDDSIQFVEDLTDTYTDLENKINNPDNVDWKRKYHELDKFWREKYRHRFFSGSGRIDDSKEVDEPEENYENVKIDEIFEEEE